MFFKLIRRNSKRDRKENGLFFTSLLISVLAFYIILSLPSQDVMVFLTKMESDAVNKLMMLIPAFFALTLFLLFFLIYYASKFQLERRRHELGMYLMLGMRRIKLFAMLLAEDFQNSLLCLLIGLPTAILLSELISLITARLVGLGILGHQVAFSPEAVLWTALGFLLIKFAAFFILSIKISKQEIGSLLVDTPDGAKKQFPPFVYGTALLVGALCLTAAYGMAIHGEAWSSLWEMGLTLVLGVFGTRALFWGMRFFMRFAGKARGQLSVFNFRQIQETVVHRSGTLSICSLLILAALCCFGAGIGISRFYQNTEPHILDYTFVGSKNEGGAAAIRQTLENQRLDTEFSDLFEMNIGYIRTTQDWDHAYQMETVLSALQSLESSESKESLLTTLGYATYPHLICLSGYNRLLSVAGLPNLELGAKEAAVYMGSEFANSEQIKLLNGVLEGNPEVSLDGTAFHLTGTVQSTNLVTDRSITLSFAMILPDEAFAYYTQGDYEVYLNAVLDENKTKNASLLSAISNMNEKLDQTGLTYESYLQNIGRQLFYMVAACYITLYLAVIFLIIANTIIGVHFLISQQKSGRRYRTLIHLGAAYPTLCDSARRQINWFFGIPVAVAALSSLFGIRALFTGILSSRAKTNISEMMVVSAAMILVLCVVEWFYMTAVKRSSDRYLLTLMVPEREE